MAPASLDLAPFGFTATESQAYATLLRLGPSTGYAVAHAARLARANTYGALEGLVARGAAARLPGRPARYREAGPIVTGSASPDTPTVLLIDDAHVISVAGAGDTAAGIWSSHPAVAALARATLRGLA